MTKREKQLPSNSTLRISPVVVSRTINDEEVLINLSTGVYFGLDPIGTRFWHLVREGQSLSDIYATMLNEYDVAEEQLNSDLCKLVATLETNGLVKRA